MTTPFYVLFILPFDIPLGLNMNQEDDSIKGRIEVNLENCGAGLISCFLEVFLVFVEFVEELIEFEKYFRFYFYELFI